MDKAPENDVKVLSASALYDFDIEDSLNKDIHNNVRVLPGPLMFDVSGSFTVDIYNKLLARDTNSKNKQLNISEVQKTSKKNKTRRT